MSKAEVFTTPAPRAPNEKPTRIFAFRILLSSSLCFLAGQLFFSSRLRGQVESVESAPAQAHWVGVGRAEGHLALGYSPAGAFSPDSSTLAVAAGGKVFLMDLGNTGLRKILNPRVEGVSDLDIQSAIFLASNRLLLLGHGLLGTKGKGVAPRTPLLAFQWDPDQDALTGKVNSIAPKGGAEPPRFFPQIGYIAFYKESNFDLWHPATGNQGRVTVPDLTQRPRVFEFSPDGRWLLLAQIETSSTPDPVVVQLKEHKFVESLRGHPATVLAISFARDSKTAATACEDGKVRLWSVPEWKLLQELPGHKGPAHWAEFSPDGKWIVTASEDRTVRIWSTPYFPPPPPPPPPPAPPTGPKPLTVEQILELLRNGVPNRRVGVLVDERGINFKPLTEHLQKLQEAGADNELVEKLRAAKGVLPPEPVKTEPPKAVEAKLVQTLSESTEPLRTVTFSPNGEFVAASGEQQVFVWQRRRGQ